MFTIYPHIFTLLKYCFFIFIILLLRIPFEETSGDILTPAMVRDLCASIELNETAPVEKSFNVALALAADG